MKLQILQITIHLFAKFYSHVDGMQTSMVHITHWNVGICFKFECYGAHTQSPKLRHVESPWRRYNAVQWGRTKKYFALPQSSTRQEKHYNLKRRKKSELPIGKNITNS